MRPTSEFPSLSHEGRIRGEKTEAIIALGTFVDFSLQQNLLKVHQCHWKPLSFNVPARGSSSTYPTLLKECSNAGGLALLSGASKKGIACRIVGGSCVQGSFAKTSPWSGATLRDGHIKREQKRSSAGHWANEEGQTGAGKGQRRALRRYQEVVACGRGRPFHRYQKHLVHSVTYSLASRGPTLAAVELLSLLPGVLLSFEVIPLLSACAFLVSYPVVTTLERCADTRACVCVF